MKLGKQLQIDVVPAPNAIGRWDREHEISAYRRTMGDEAFVRQQRLAEEAKECTCGRQAAADAEAAKQAHQARRSKRLLGWEHKPGCNSYTRRNPKLALHISVEEQKARYEAEREETREEEAS